MTPKRLPQDILIEEVVPCEFDVYLLTQRARLWVSMQEEVCPAHLLGKITVMNELQALAFVGELPPDFHVFISTRPQGNPTP